MNETASSTPVAVTAGTTQPIETPAEQPQQPGGLMGSMGSFLPLVLLFGVFYFMLIRPQQRKEKERQKMIEELRAGAKIIFAGGFIGVIQEATEKTFKVEIAPGVAVEVARSSVTAVIPPETPAAK